MQEHRFRERNQESACSYPLEQNAVPLQCLLVRTTVLKEPVEKWGAKNFRTLLSLIIFRPPIFRPQALFSIPTVLWFGNAESRRAQRQNAHRLGRSAPEQLLCPLEVITLATRV